MQSNLELEPVRLMWIPRSAEEIENAAKQGSIAETASFDAKQEISSSSKEIAKDVAAMSTDGGVLLYGIGEDENDNPTELHPFELAGERERIARIIATCISEPPEVTIKPYPKEDDPATGYIAVVVPTSARAPHMVTKKRDNRYYGRDSTGNVRLGQGEVERLYRRRERSERDRDEMLNDAIARTPIGPSEDYGFLHVVLEPAFPAADIITRAESSFSEERAHSDVDVFLSNCVTQARRYSFEDSWPYLRHGTWTRDLDGWTLYPSEDLDRHRTEGTSPRAQDTLVLSVFEDGKVRLFCGRGAERWDDKMRVVERLLVELATHAIHFAGVLYRRAGYNAKVNVGVSVTGIEGAHTSVGGKTPHSVGTTPYPEAEYRRTTQVSAMRLDTEAYEIADELWLPLIRVLTKQENNPIKPKSRP